MKSYWGLLAILPFVAVGCGSGATERKMDLKATFMGNATDDDKAKIRGALDKAGIKGEISLIERYDDKGIWTVEVVPAAEPGKRSKGGAMSPPQYTIDTKTWTVKDPPKKGGRGGDLAP